MLLLETFNILIHMEIDRQICRIGFKNTILDEDGYNTKI